MSFLSRRQFIATSGTAGIATLPASLLAADSKPAQKLADQRSPFRITGIEAHEILLPFQDFNATSIARYHGEGVQYRTIFIVKTDNGLEGIGESWSRGWPKPDAYAKYVGTSPFDWVGDNDNLPINMALYDLMGKYLGVPVWKLLGPKVRSWVPVAAWTVSQHPDAMAEEVRQAARRGYHWMKFHVDELQSVVEQTAAMQKVAPRGFKVHYDFNANSSYEAVYPVLRELERFPVAGRIEDPISPQDRDGWRMIRQKCKLTFLGHHTPIDFMLEHLCDGLLAGHAPVGQALKMAAVAESTNVPFMLQQCGGTINQAFLAHEAAVFKMATIDHVDLVHLWKDDVTVERMPVVGGSVAVLDRPGLGVTLDREKLERYKKTSKHERGRFLVRVRYTYGPTIYFRHDPDLPGATDHLRYLSRLNVPGPVAGYGNPVVSDFWDDDNSMEFQRLWKETESGPVALPGSGSNGR